MAGALIGAHRIALSFYIRDAAKAPSVTLGLEQRITQTIGRIALLTRKLLKAPDEPEPVNGTNLAGVTNNSLKEKCER